MARVALLLTITFLAVAPFSSRASDRPVFIQPTCQELVDRRLGWAAISGTAAVGLITLAPLVI